MSDGRSSARGAEPEKGFGSSSLSGESALGALPLRLSLGRGGLSIELTAPQEVGSGVTLLDLSLGLEALEFPLDLSKGVKQFRSRRTRLDEFTLRVRLETLTALVGDLPFGLERLTARLRNEENATAPARDIVVGIVAVGDRRALSFDLVLTFGKRPRFVVDEIVALGLECSPLFAALSVVDALSLRVEEATGERLFRRMGRSCEVGALPRAALLRVLPGFGLRLPKDDGCALVGLDVDASGLVFRYARSEAADVLGRRGLRLAGLADHLFAADELLAKDETTSARIAYLAALEQAPREVSCLLALGHLDSGFDGRWESARSYFEEARSALGDERRASVEVALAEHLAKGSDRLVAIEHYRTASRSLEPSLAGLALLAARELEPDVEERRRLLDEAIRRAPTLPMLSLERFRQSVADGDLGLATRDAERYLAAAKNERAAASFSRILGGIYLNFGYGERALSHLQRAHRVEPADVETRVLLARVLRERGEEARALPLLVELANEFEASGAAVFGGLPVESTLAETRFQIAHIYGRVLEERSLAVAELRRIESRGALGAAARGFEAELMEELGDAEGRIRARARLLEAAELGILELEIAAPALLAAARRELRWGDSALARRMAAFLREREAALAPLCPSPLAELAELEVLLGAPLG